MRRLLFAMFLVGGLAACGEDANRLYGSMSQVYPLDFDRVRIVRQVSASSDEVAIEYRRNSDQARVAKLTVIVGDLANLAGNEIDLTETVGGSSGLPRGTLSRVESTTTLFTLERGNVRFDQEPTLGTNLSGTFHATLADPAGRTLNGDFQAKVEAP